MEKILLIGDDSIK